MLVRDYKGKRADRLVTRSGPGVVSLVAEIRGHELLLEERGGTWPICSAALAGCSKLARACAESDAVASKIRYQRTLLQRRCGACITPPSRTYLRTRSTGQKLPSCK